MARDQVGMEVVANDDLLFCYLLLDKHRVMCRCIVWYQQAVVPVSELRMPMMNGIA